MLPVGFEPTISAGERPQTYALDRAATGTGCFDIYFLGMFKLLPVINELFVSQNELTDRHQQ
jgi:hypothetical protein